MNLISKNGCTTGCTQPNQLSPTTMILHTQSDAILLIRCPSLEARSPVAPNVAGSIPVSHPNFQDSLANPCRSPRSARVLLPTVSNQDVA